jgi:hypothetical protein
MRNSCVSRILSGALLIGINVSALPAGPPAPRSVPTLSGVVRVDGQFPTPPPIHRVDGQFPTPPPIHRVDGQFPTPPPAMQPIALAG